MASGGSGENSLAEFVSAILQLVFHLLFPFIVVSLFGLSYVLVVWFHMPEFGLWFGLGMVAVDYARGNIWVAIGLGLFVLAALPLAWIAYREQQVQVSKTILQWIIAAGVIFGMFWLRTNWPYEKDGWQLFSYGIIMFTGWAAFTEAMLATLSIVAHIRRSRPRKVRPPVQEPHGAPRERRSARDEPETI
jgi:hypothetical protein